MRRNLNQACKISFTLLRNLTSLEVVKSDNLFISPQVNFFNDHTKIVLIPGAGDVLVIYIDKQREGTSYLMSDISSQGCASEMVERLRYCKRVLKKVWDLVEEEDNS